MNQGHFNSSNGTQLWHYRKQLEKVVLIFLQYQASGSMSSPTREYRQKLLQASQDFTVGGSTWLHISAIKGQCNKCQNHNATDNLQYLVGAVWYSTCRSHCAGTRGAVIVFNEGPLYRFSAVHPPPNEQSSKAFTLFKIPHLSASTPMHHPSLYCWLKTMR